MLVTLTFEVNGTPYRIERGRKPNIFKYLINDVDNNNGITDEGEGRESQRVIERVLGMSHTMFKHILALNTYTEPFLSLKRTIKPLFLIFLKNKKNLVKM